MYSRFQALFLAAPLEVEARSQETGASGQVADWLAAPYDESPVNCLEPIVEFQGGLRRVLGDGIEQQSKSVGPSCFRAASSGSHQVLLLGGVLARIFLRYQTIVAS